jgi:hypothetical protein
MAQGSSTEIGGFVIPGEVEESLKFNLVPKTDVSPSLDMTNPELPRC